MRVPVLANPPPRFVWKPALHGRGYGADQETIPSVYVRPKAREKLIWRLAGSYEPRGFENVEPLRGLPETGIQSIVILAGTTAKLVCDEKYGHGALKLLFLSLPEARLIAGRSILILLMKGTSQTRRLPSPKFPKNTGKIP